MTQHRLAHRDDRRPIRRTRIIAGLTTLAAASALTVAVSTHATSAGAASSPQGTWTYGATLAATKQEQQSTAVAAKSAAAASSAAASKSKAAADASAKAAAKASAAAAAVTKAKAAYDKASGSGVSKAKKTWTDAIAARQSADAAAKRAATVARDARNAAASAASKSETASSVAAGLVDRIKRLQTMYGTTTTTSPAFTKLKSYYTFPGSRINTKDWSVYNSAHTGAGMLRNPGYITVSRNQLHVVAWNDTGSGTCLCRGTSYPTKPYGRFEVRAKVTRDANHGVAILLWPNEGGRAAGELDLAEFNASRTKVAFAIHYGGEANLQKQTYIAGDYRTWHTYRLDWNSKGLAYYIDNKLIAITTDTKVIPKIPMHLALQAAPNSVSHPVRTSTRMDVSSVKVYTP